MSPDSLFRYLFVPVHSLESPRVETVMLVEITVIDRENVYLTVSGERVKPKTMEVKNVNEILNNMKDHPFTGSYTVLRSVKVDDIERTFVTIPLVKTSDTDEDPTDLALRVLGRYHVPISQHVALRKAFENLASQHRLLEKDSDADDGETIEQEIKNLESEQTHLGSLSVDDDQDDTSRLAAPLSTYKELSKKLGEEFLRKVMEKRTAVTHEEMKRRINEKLRILETEKTKYLGSLKDDFFQAWEEEIKTRVLDRQGGRAAEHDEKRATEGNAILSQDERRTTFEIVNGAQTEQGAAVSYDLPSDLSSDDESDAGDDDESDDDASDDDESDDDEAGVDDEAAVEHLRLGEEEYNQQQEQNEQAKWERRVDEICDGVGALHDMKGDYARARNTFIETCKLAKDKKGPFWIGLDRRKTEEDVLKELEDLRDEAIRNEPEPREVVDRDLFLKSVDALINTATGKKTLLDEEEFAVFLRLAEQAKDENASWTDDSRELTPEEMLEKLEKAFPKEKTANEIRSGWNAVHAVASGLDTVLGLGREPSERPPTSVPRPVSAGPDTEAFWINM